MFLVPGFFFGDRPIDVLTRQRLKAKLEARRRYYTEKLDFLTSKKINPRLARLACRDAPAPLRARTGKGFIKACARYYRHEVKRIDSQLKKI